MITNYDAEAIAEVMGLAFLQDPPDDALRPSSPSAGTGRSSGSPAADFVIQIDDARTTMVEIIAHKTLAPFTAGTCGGDLEACRVLSPSPVFIEKAVERGLPRAALRHVAESLAGGDKAKVSALEWGVVPKTTLERRVTQLSPQESERTERVARLFVHARRALGTEGEAREFMTTPHPELDGRSPLEVARTELGTRRAEALLNAIEYGLAF